MSSRLYSSTGREASPLIRLALSHQLCCELVHPGVGLICLHALQLAGQPLKLQPDDAGDIGIIFWGVVQLESLEQLLVQRAVHRVRRK